MAAEDTGIDWSNNSDHFNYFNFTNYNDTWTYWNTNQSMPFFELFDYDYFDIGVRAARILSEPDKVLIIMLSILTE